MSDDKNDNLGRLVAADMEENTERYLEFSLGEEVYAMPLLKVREVIAMPETTPVPFTPDHFLGIMNLRGQVISVIDLRDKLKIKTNVKIEDEESEIAVIIIDLDPIFLGVVVDSVNSVLTVETGNVNPTPQIESSRNADYITGVYRKNNNLILLLDVARVLDLEDKKAIDQSLEIAG
tara:strand:+ start:15 stop:545 length:531 start_codon:yes stop_codon:yes gene_type:complete